ncbi:MAG: MFS transporter [Planctomycetia bacterium]
MHSPTPLPERPLPPTVRGLGWTSFLTDLSSEAIYPLLPAFVMRELGGSALSVGLLDGVANLVAALVRLPSGALSDRIGRRPLILIGYGVSALVRPLMGLVATPWGALVVRAADRFGKGVRTAPRDALVADLVPTESRGRAFGHIRALDHAGAALGPLVAMLFLLACPGRERLLFLLSVVPGIVTLLVIWRLVHDPPQTTPRATETALVGRLDRGQWPLLVSVAVWALGASSEQFLLLRAADLGVSQPLVPLVWLGVSFAKGAAATRAGRLADRFHPRRSLAAGWLLFAAGYAGLALAPGLALALPMMVVIAIAYGLAEPAERALVAAIAPAGRQGGAFGWYALVQGAMALPAGLLAGWLWQQGPHGPSWAFGATAVLSVLACGLLMAPSGPTAVGSE